MPILIKLVIDGSCGALNALGGGGFLWMRRYVMPIILGVGMAIITHTWWVAFLTWPAIGTLSLGYFSGANWGRGLWLFVQAIALSTGLMLTHHISLIMMIPYVIGAGLLGGLYKNWPQIIGDFITGCYLGLVIFLVY